MNLVLWSLHWPRTIFQIHRCAYQACDFFSECWQSSLFWGGLSLCIDWEPYLKFKAVLVIRPAICFLNVGNHLCFGGFVPLHQVAEHQISNSKLCLLSGLRFVFWKLAVIWFFSVLPPLHWLRTIFLIQRCAYYQACDLFSECWQSESSLYWIVLGIISNI